MSPLAEKRRLVIKIGSALLVRAKEPFIRQEWLTSLCEDIGALHHVGYEIVIVSSGAVSLARHRMGHATSRLKLGEKQALASIGQVHIAHAWQKALQSYGLASGQLLLTPEDTEDRQRHLHARRTLESILRMKAIPIINENDAIAVEELHFGDNDRLAARVTQMIGAELLILFSDIDGLYTVDPRTNPTATHIPVVRHLSEEVMATAGGPPTTGHSSGGMRTKLLAAHIATRAGSDMIIAKGEQLHPLKALQEGALCTHFMAHHGAGSARKKWIASTLHPQGTLTLDDGAVEALHDGASLLSIGITHIEGTFERGAIVTCQTMDHRILGRGISNYASHDLKSITQPQERRVVIHRNNLTLD